MKRTFVSAALGIAVGIIAHSSVLGRGVNPPPPPFSGGNVGAWLGSGPIFGFEDGGGSNGGWGGSYFELGGWNGWGSGAGGSGGYRGRRGPNTDGRGHDWEGGELGGLHGTCWVERLPGRRSECACSIKYRTITPPPSGTRLYGVCAASEVTQDWYYSCNNSGDPCSGYMP